MKQESPVSFSALRWDLPPALFTVHEQSDASGFVLHPSEVKVDSGGVGGVGCGVGLVGWGVGWGGGLGVCATIVCQL